MFMHVIFGGAIKTELNWVNTQLNVSRCAYDDWRGLEPVVQ